MFLSQLGNEIETGFFKNCNKLKHINIPSFIYTIGREAFNCLTSLESVLISSSLKEIGESAFCECTSLKKVAFNSDQPVLGFKRFLSKAITNYNFAIRPYAL